MNFIDLFAGAGGLSEGFISAGFEPVAHVELDEAACFSLRTRMTYHYLNSIGRHDIYKSYLKGKIGRKELYSFVPNGILESVINLPIGPEFNTRIHQIIHKQLKGRQVDLMVGGPPCQAYSLIGRARSKNGMEGDPRNYLYVEYANYLVEYRPKMFVFENVLGLKSAKKGQYLADMEAKFKEAGYYMKPYIVEANNFGVLQKRKRVIIIGWRSNLKPEIPDLSLVRNFDNFKVCDIFSDLPEIKAGEGKEKNGKYISPSNAYLRKYRIRNGAGVLTQHVTRPHTEQDKQIYKIAVKKWNNERKRLDYNSLPEHLKTHNNRDSFFDRFKVVAQDLGYSQTVVAHICKDGHYYIHPDSKQNRSISVREAARLQSFPDNYYFEGVREGSSRTAAFKQIGNAVPPVMAEKIGVIIKEVIKKLRALN